MKLARKAKKLLEEYSSKIDKDYNIELHVKLMIRYGLKKPQPSGFDKDTYSAACWLHDIGRFHEKDSLEDREKHRELGVKIFEKEFSEAIVDSNAKAKIRACIAEHSGKLKSKSFPELETIREADRISFLHPAFANHFLKTAGRDKAKLKLDYNYRELLSQNPSGYAKKLAKKWYEKSMRILI